ncbi:MAG: uroporphyrinogen decarboxylase family protein [Bacteroidia bacterium]|nr:uroporphyrinogen decarboxylase family protein [Bacteroidia bacterium]
MKLENDLMLRVAYGTPVERAPVCLPGVVWAVPDFQGLLDQDGNAQQVMATPDLAARATVMAADHFEVDGVYLFTDYLAPLLAMGLEYYPHPQFGPHFSWNLEGSGDLPDFIPAANPASYAHIAEAIRLAKDQLRGRVPLIGRVLAPWSTYTYLCQGHGLPPHSYAKLVAFTDPIMGRQLLDIMIDIANAQLSVMVEAGVDLIELYDPLAGCLDRIMFREFSLHYLARLCSNFRQVPKIVRAGGVQHSFDLLSQLDCEILALDQTVEPEFAALRIKGKAIMGNLDTCMLGCDPERVTHETRRMLHKFPRQKHIASTGTDIFYELEEESIAAFIEAIRGVAW